MRMVHHMVSQPPDQDRKHHQSPEAGLVSLPSQYPTEANTILTCLTIDSFCLPFNFIKRDSSMHPLVFNIMSVRFIHVIVCIRSSLKQKIYFMLNSPLYEYTEVYPFYC